ncbi:unnamed protein product, partial [Polarella glacialis]
AMDGLFGVVQGGQGQQAQDPYLQRSPSRGRPEYQEQQPPTQPQLQPYGGQAPPTTLLPPYNNNNYSDNYNNNDNNNYRRQVPKTNLNLPQYQGQVPQTRLPPEYQVPQTRVPEQYQQQQMDGHGLAAHRS